MRAARLLGLEPSPLRTRWYRHGDEFCNYIASGYRSRGYGRWILTLELANVLAGDRWGCMTASAVCDDFGDLVIVGGLR